MPLCADPAFMTHRHCAFCLEVAPDLGPGEKCRCCMNQEFDGSCAPTDHNLSCDEDDDAKCDTCVQGEYCYPESSQKEFLCQE